MQANLLTCASSRRAFTHASCLQDALLKRLSDNPPDLERTAELGAYVADIVPTFRQAAAHAKSDFRSPGRYDVWPYIRDWAWPRLHFQLLRGAVPLYGTQT